MPWTDRKLILACALGLLCAPGPVRAEDVEHDPVLIEQPAPRPKPPKPPRPPAQKPDAVAEPPAPTIPAGPRFQGPGRTPRRIDLSPGLDFLAPPVEALQSEHDRVADNLEGYLLLQRSRDRVRSGQVDPAWIDLAQRMDHYFQPGFELIREPRVAEVSGAWLRDTAWRFIHGWYQDVQRQRTDLFARPPRTVGDEAAESLVRIMDMQREALASGAYGNTVVTLVEVRFGEDGRSQAQMVNSSGYPEYDRVAIQSVEQALANDWGDAPPPGPARSIYALTSNFSILPPLPVVGFTFDIMLGKFEPIYPFRKMVSSKAVLVAVYRPKDDGQRVPWSDDAAGPVQAEPKQEEPRAP